MTREQWQEINQSVQLHEIPVGDLPRLLFMATRDIERLYDGIQLLDDKRQETNDILQEMRDTLKELKSTGGKNAQHNWPQAKNS